MTTDTTRTPEVSEAEVEAGARVLDPSAFGIKSPSFVTFPPLGMTSDEWRQNAKDCVRPILEAAARVRSEPEAVAAAREEWRPIESAPRDGTVVDLFNAFGSRLTDYQWLTGAQRDPSRFGPGAPWERLRMDGWAEIGSKEGNSCTIEAHLTHWRPLPEPPVVRALDEGGGDA